MVYVSANIKRSVMQVHYAVHAHISTSISAIRKEEKQQHEADEGALCNTSQLQVNDFLGAGNQNEDYNADQHIGCPHDNSRDIYQILPWLKAPDVLQMQHSYLTAMQAKPGKQDWEFSYSTQGKS